MSEQDCTAKVEDVQIGPNTEISVECGLTNRDHLAVHMTRQFVGELTIVITWPGSFAPAKEVEG